MTLAREKCIGLWFFYDGCLVNHMFGSPYVSMLMLRPPCLDCEVGLWSLHDGC